ILSCQTSNHLRRQYDNVGGHALAQFVGHRADRAELSRDIEPGHFPEFRRKARDQALGRAAAENVQAGHEVNSIAAIIRRYGFHGLSYEYIASVLPDILGPAQSQPDHLSDAARVIAVGLVELRLHHLCVPKTLSALMR